VLHKVLTLPVNACCAASSVCLHDVFNAGLFFLRRADIMFQVRCAVYNGTLGSGFGPRFRPGNDSCPQAALAACPQSPGGFAATPVSDKMTASERLATDAFAATIAAVATGTLRFELQPGSAALSPSLFGATGLPKAPWKASVLRFR
jgi:hypothetical protein